MSTPTPLHPDVPKPINGKRYSWSDLVRITGLGRDQVKAAMLSGELPGHKVGKLYVIPVPEFVAFCEGRWQQRRRPVLDMPAAPVLLRRKAS